MVIGVIQGVFYVVDKQCPVGKPWPNGCFECLKRREQSSEIDIIFNDKRYNDLRDLCRKNDKFSLESITDADELMDFGVKPVDATNAAMIAIDVQNGGRMNRFNDKPSTKADPSALPPQCIAEDSKSNDGNETATIDDPSLTV